MSVTKTVQDIFMDQLFSEYPSAPFAHDALETLSNFQFLERLSWSIEQRLSAQTGGSQP